MLWISLCGKGNVLRWFSLRILGDSCLAQIFICLSALNPPLQCHSINFKLIEIEFLRIVYVHHYYTLRLLHDCILISFLSFIIHLLLFIRIFAFPCFGTALFFSPFNFVVCKFESVYVFVSCLKGRIFPCKKEEQAKPFNLCIYIKNYIRAANAATPFVWYVRFSRFVIKHGFACCIPVWSI